MLQHDEGTIPLDDKELLKVIQTRVGSLERKIQQLSEEIPEEEMEQMINAAKQFNLLMDVSASDKSEL